MKDILKKPLISVIVAVYNGSGTLKKCIESVSDQSYPDRELIVIDGGSKDGTVEVIKAAGKQIGYWVSEHDRGIYHAWNKALEKAKGDWVCFLGSDDRFSDGGSLSALAEAADEEVNLVSARVRLIDPSGSEGRTIGMPWDWEAMKRYHCVAHPGALHKKSLFESLGAFDESYSIAGDYEFLLRAGRGISAAFVDRVVVLMGDSGSSRKSVGKVLLETKKIQEKHPEIGPVKAALNYRIASAKAVARRLLCVR